MLSTYIFGEFFIRMLHKHTLALASFMDTINENKLLLVRHLLPKMA